MSPPHLAPEIFDQILDNFCEEPEVLKNCCIVAKSWISRTRKHLFAETRFNDHRALQSWKKAFSNPLSSPGRFTKTLYIASLHNVTMADGDANGWIRAFSNVCVFDVDTTNEDFDFKVSLVPFHGFSPSLKSLTFKARSLHFEKMLNLAFSFPLLEDLTVEHAGEGDEDDNLDEIMVRVPEVYPPLSGKLDLSFLPWKLEFFADELSKIPNGIRFRKLSLLCYSWKHSVEPLKALVAGCSNTLESLNIRYIGTFVCPRLKFNSPKLIHFAESTDMQRTLFRLCLDISKAKKLRRIKFVSQKSTVEWVAKTLESLARDQGQVRITIDYHVGPAQSRANHHRLVDAIGPTLHKEWMALDKLIVQRWKSNAIQTTIRIYEPSPEDPKWSKEWVPTLFPEAWNNGAICGMRLKEWYEKAPFMAAE
jgi:hypothetical protein